MKLTAISIALLAVAVAVVPYFSNCQHQGKMMALASGRLAPMRCYWTARAELALAAPLFGLAGLLAFSRRQETRRVLTGLGALLGGMVILLPTSLIGVCQHPDAICSLVLKPAMSLTGLLVIGVSLAGLVASERAGRRVLWSRQGSPTRDS